MFLHGLLDIVRAAPYRGITMKTDAPTSASAHPGLETVTTDVVTLGVLCAYAVVSGAYLFAGYFYFASYLPSGGL